MKTPSSYPKKDWERHAIKYYKQKQQMQIADAKLKMMDNARRKYDNSLNSKQLYELINALIQLLR